MNFAQYQELSKRTAPRGIPWDKAISNYTMGASGELGEFIDEIKKIEHHNHPINKDVLEKELGDVLWYLARICDMYAMRLDIVAEKNIEKLKKRYPNGFSSELSRNRQE